MVNVKTALTVLLMVSLGISACGDDDGDAEEAGTTANEGGEPILIKERVNAATRRGKVLRGSVIGDSPFCHGGRTHEKHAPEPAPAGVPLIVTTYVCPGGRLQIGFSPTQPTLKQTTTWEIVDGSGDFEGWRGDGRITVTFERADPTQGRARSTGTVAR